MPTTTVTLEAIEVAVEVTTFCTPLMSLVSRDCTSPPRAWVKNPTDWRCRRSNSPVRRSCITRWPTVVDSQVCTTPIIAVAAATPTMAPTSHSSSATSCWGSASSIRRCTRKGWARPIAGAGDDQADHDGEPALEGREQAGDPAQRDGGVGELSLVGADLGGVGAVAAATAASHGEVIHVTTSDAVVRYAEVTSS